MTSLNLAIEAPLRHACDRLGQDYETVLRELELVARKCAETLVGKVSGEADLDLLGARATLRVGVSDTAKYGRVLWIDSLQIEGLLHISWLPFLIDRGDWPPPKS